MIAGGGHIEPDSVGDSFAIEPMFRRGGICLDDANANRTIVDLSV